mmetsp:Transcript_21591/g.30178  ORF Transcript_21591/g.30178 Transcript_21591/m.30178 type:complete len:282 (-) Transcript_21591:15-860(-)
MVQQMVSFQIPSVIGGYQVQEQMGTGTFSVVHKGYHIDTGLVVALKFTMKSNSVIREMKILRRLQHPYVIRLLTVIITDHFFCLVLEWIEGKDLLTTLQTGKLPEHEALDLFRQILETLHYCHSKNVIHRDIKPENILIDADKKIKLIDFGLATLCDNTPQVRRACGSIFYAAPEVHAELPYFGPEADMWSLGVVLYCMVTGMMPWGRQNLVDNILNGKYFPIGPESNVSPNCAQLISRLLVVDPAQRATAADVFAHPWLSEQSPNFVPTAGNCISNTSGN